MGMYIRICISNEERNVIYKKKRGKKQGGNIPINKSVIIGDGSYG